MRLKPDNINSLLFQVDVEDTIAPVWTYIPPNATLELNVDTLNVNFTATDPSGIGVYFINDSNFVINATK